MKVSSSLIDISKSVCKKWSLSKLLQTENLDLEFADMTQSTVKQICNNADAEFDNILS